MNHSRTKVTLRTLKTMKDNAIPASFITAYDYPSAVFANDAGIDMILVGDSGGMTMLGYTNTLPVTMDEMLHFSKAVCRGNRHAFVVGDMPFMSYQDSNQGAVRNAGRFIAEARCDAVKVEICSHYMVRRIGAIAAAGISVMAHLGLTPQSLSSDGGYRVHGKTREDLKTIIDLAGDCERYGASFILLEAMPEECAAIVRSRVTIPVYGIGAGKKLDGQLLILHDVLGSFVGDVHPKFAKHYANLGSQITNALASYHREVKEGLFPAPGHCYTISEEELERIRQEFK